MPRPTRLLQTLRLTDLKDFHLGRLARIDVEDFGPVRAKVKADMLKLGRVVTDGWLNEGILALKQYYAVAVLDPVNQHAVSDLVDPFWHAHILHTKQYVQFCQDVTGGYIHHTPLNHEDVAEVARVGQLYNYTSECYAQFFNYADPEFMPQTLPDVRRVCLHQDVRCETVRAHALLPSVTMAFKGM